MMIKVMLSEGAFKPTRAHPDDAGLDLFVPYDLCIGRSESLVSEVNVRVRVAIPKGYVGLILDKSGMGKRGLKVFGGVIDSGYRGELIVMMMNLGCRSITIERGKAIAQLVIVPVMLDDCEIAGQLDTTERGEKGFGSSDHKGA